MKSTFTDFPQFYSAYLKEHANPTCRKIHFAGSAFFMVTVVAAFYLGLVWLPLVGVVLGYGTSWVSHFFFEKNVPTSFGYPIWSMHAGRMMFFEMLTGKLDMTKEWES